MEKIYLEQLSCYEMQNNEENKYFKQLNIYENFNSCFKENNIKFTNSIIKINCAKIINTIERCSLENQYLSGKKLIVMGKICIEIFISDNNGMCKYYYPKQVEMPFSTFLIIPKNTCEKEDIHLEYCIEDISIASVIREKLLISVTFLLGFQEKFLKYN